MKDSEVVEGGERRLDSDDSDHVVKGRDQGNHNGWWQRNHNGWNNGKV